MGALRTATLILAVAANLSAQQQTIDAARSVVTVHVYKAGAFSFAGHEHRIEAHDISGTVDRAAGSEAVEFVLHSKALIVTDAELSEADRAKIEETMRNQVLEIDRYPEIKFRSSVVKPDQDNIWNVNGSLTLHGVERPINLRVRKEDGAYVGEARLRQTDYGITPVKAAGGAVRVKDELLIGFRIGVK